MQVNPRVGRALQRKPKFRRLLESQRETQADSSEACDIRWLPDHARVSRVILKNARAHLFYENGERMLEATHSVSYAPLLNMDDEQRAYFFEQGSLEPWCEVGSRWNTRVICGDTFDQDGFLVVQSGAYRFRIEGGGLGVSSVIHEYLATSVSW